MDEITKSIYAVAVMTEQDNGTYDLKQITVESASREEAIGTAFQKYVDNGVIVHKINAMRISDGENDPAIQNYLSLLREGKKIHCIKAIRDDTGMGLKEAKDYAERLQDQYNIPRNIRPSSYR